MAEDFEGEEFDLGGDALARASPCADHTGNVGAAVRYRLVLTGLTGEDNVFQVGSTATDPIEFAFTTPGLLGSEAIKWNFTKFLADGQGRVTRRYAPTTTPAELARDIEALLG